MDTIIVTGARAPQFQLPDLKSKLYALVDLMGQIVVLNFWSAECTWCERVDQELLTYLDPWKDQVKVLWIASNANETRELIEKVANTRQLPAVLLDTHHQVADLYGAQTTPHFFVVDATGLLRYQGAWDDVTFRQRKATQVYVPLVVEALREGLTSPITQSPPYGCVLLRLATSHG